MTASYTCSLDPVTSSNLQLYLYREVKNVEEIRKNILEGAWKCSVIKPSLVLHPLQVAVAANKAAVSQQDGTLTTRSVFSEILFNLSLTKNITQSLTKFGIEKENNILVAFVDAEDVQRDKILSQIEGEMCPIAHLNQFSNLSDIKKTYKLDKLECKTNEDLLDLIVSRMVTKSFVSY